MHKNSLKIFTPPSGIHDNCRQRVADFLKTHPTFYAFDILKAELSQIRQMCFLFGEPRFIRAIEPEKIIHLVGGQDADLLEATNR